MKKIATVLCAGASLAALSTPAFAQNDPAAPPTSLDDSTAGPNDAEIIVTARRRDESIQDVPLVVNAVTSENIQKLNLREFEEIENLVPGLSLSSSANGIGAQASLRGVNFDVNASGNNGTIEFYLNDAPLSGGILFQSMYDVGQIEVLRGPQGTLRGRASPSGSITVTTRRPDLSEAGGYALGTINDIGGWNLNGAMNIPLIADVLAIRLAGVVDENNGNRVHSINSDLDPFVKTRGGRISVAAEPAEWISLFGSYSTNKREVRQFGQFESARNVDPTAPAGPVQIDAKDRLGVAFAPSNTSQRFEVFNWQAQVRFGGQKIDYVGSHNKQRYFADVPNDTGAFFGPSYPAALRLASQITNSSAKQTTHEVRLSNDERVAGIFDYIVGGLYSKLDSPTTLTNQTPLFSGILIPQAAFPTFITTGGITPAGLAARAAFASIVNTPVLRGGSTLEKSLFGNVTAHIGQGTEISGGTRYITYKSQGSLAISGVPVAAANEDTKDHAWIFSASAKHRFNEDLMVYASFGSSWRPGPATNPIILREVTNPTGTLADLYFPDPEKSKSYEIGFKSNWLDRRLLLNVTAYHQDFKNYAYSARNVYFSGRDASGATRVFNANPGIAVGVPAKVDGVEAEIAFQATRQWNLTATASYAKSKIKNGVVPCNVYNGQVPTLAQIAAASGGQQVATCNADFRAGSLPPFSATVQSEYLQPITPSIDGYLRGLMTFAGKSQNDATNPFDDIGAFALVNLFAGIRDPEGGWEIGGYVKNVFEVERVTSRDNTPANVSYQQLFCTDRDPRLAGICPPGTITFGQTGTSGYRAVALTPPREFGVTARFQFGSR